MTLDKLEKIQEEIKRFSSTVEEAIVEIKSSEYCMKYGLGGTSLSGAVRRRYIDLKYEINKIL